MTVVSSLIQDAYRETNISPVGVALTAAQTTEGLRLLRTLQLDAFRVVYKDDEVSMNAQVAIPLLSTNQWSFSAEFDDYFIISLAMRLSPRNGAPVDQLSLMRYQRAKARFFAHYAQTVEQVSEGYDIAGDGYRFYPIDFETGT